MAKTETAQGVVGGNGHDPFVDLGIDQNQITALQAPFDPFTELEFRAIQWTKENNAAIAFAYITPRAAIRRLEKVFPGQFSLVTEVLPPINNGIPLRVAVKATITVRGVSRSGIGEADVLFKTDYQTHQPDYTKLANEPYKSAESDAIKRAGFNWGIGAYLYDIPMVWINWEGTREGGSFTENPAEVIFGKDGSINADAAARDQKRGRKGRTKSAIAAAGVPVSVAPPVAPGIPTVPGVASPPAAPATMPAVPPAAPPTASAPAAVPAAPAASPPAPGSTGKTDITAQCQMRWLLDVYGAAGATIPPDLVDWPREKTNEHIIECIRAGGNSNPVTPSQLKVLVNVSEQLGLALPADLASLTVSTASPIIGDLIAQAKGQG